MENLFPLSDLYIIDPTKMGCNKSKPAVATNNTISRRPFRKKSSIKTKDVDPIAENNPHVVTKNPSPLHQVEVHKPNNDDVRDISVNTDTKDAQVDHGAAVVEAGKSISSPDHYFSSRKDEYATESVGTEDGYFSPNRDSVKDEELKENVELKDEVDGNVVQGEQKSLVEEEPASLDDGETKIKEDEKDIKDNAAKDTSVNADNKDSQIDEQNKVEEGVLVLQHGKSISSPDHYFSSRKDEDAIESVGTEDGYFSPNKDSIKDAELKENVELIDEVDENVVQDEQVVDNLAKEETTNLDDKEAPVKEDEKGKIEELNEPNSHEEDKQKIMEPPEPSQEPSSDKMTGGTTAN